MLNEQKKGPEARLVDFDQYRNLMNGEHAKKVIEFIQGSHTFQEYCDLVLEYREIEKNITVNVWGVVNTGLYDFNRTGLINMLEGIARYLQNELLQKMVSDQQNEMELLQAQYKAIFDNALSMPERTAELLELEVHVRQTKIETIPKMEDRLKEVSPMEEWS